MAWIKYFNRRAGRGGTDHKCQSSARKLSDTLNVRNKEGKESGRTGRLGAWGVGQPREGRLGQAQRGEGALPPEPELLPRRQTAPQVKLGPARAGRCEGCPRKGVSEVVKIEIFFFF